MRGKETGVQCLCVCEREKAGERLCVFVFSFWCLFESAHAHGMRTHHSCVRVCVHLCLCVFDLTEGWGVLYWKVLLSSPVQHAGLAPAVSHGAVPPSPLPICIRRRQAEMWQTNLAHTVPAASRTWTLLPLSRLDKNKTHKIAQASEPTCMRAPRDKDVFPESKLCCINKIKSSARLQFEACIPPGDHSDSQVQKCEWLKEVRRAFVALSFGQNSPWIKVSSPSFFPLPPRW